MSLFCQCFMLRVKKCMVLVTGLRIMDGIDKKYGNIHTFDNHKVIFMLSTFKLERSRFNQWKRQARATVMSLRLEKNCLPLLIKVE